MAVENVLGGEMVTSNHARYHKLADDLWKEEHEE